ncbi:sigma-54 interaction domain-containing protein [Edaphobacillus lindanitolerans]|uniref:PAS domain S-box-containing protein n=1 Tax=Edaphobacillus lindanitolerans TaxID=550447 RepID=A0A1U7PI64_9BACI|nr:sigma 54-interacting transcriptional regulator [Edaphobacillus lindanitolerans]SIT71851.1 PAS domain S-box-containing protein [Edaphobacillus lindanitolerans]
MIKQPLEIDPFMSPTVPEEETLGTSVLSVRIGRPLEEAFALLGDYPYLLVEDEDGNKIGHLSYETIALTMLEAFKRKCAYLNTILGTINESCTVIDEEARVVHWTRGAEDIFSVKDEDILGRPITDFFRSDQLEILKSLQDGSSVLHQQHHAREDLVVLINSNPVLLDGEIVGAVVAETDITSQIRLNNELHSTSEKLFRLEEQIRKTSSSADPFSYIKGNSRELKRTIDLTTKAARTMASILINGESGTGKELFAKAVHHLRENGDAPFIAINCGAISESLFESEIFGYEKGAFSGADAKGKKGKVELAKGGTLFLDEIGEMPLEMQVKFLRLLQEKRFFRVGGTKEIEVDFRVVAATNRNLKELVDEGKFREDLYYRLNVVNIKIPPLRDRIEDILELSHYFLYEFSVKYNRPIHGVSQEVMQSLLKHDWPGNIRELRNVIERLVIFSDNGEIKADDLPAEIERITEPAVREKAELPAKNGSGTLAEQLQEYERAVLVRELENAGGNKQLCASNLGITRATLYNRMNKLGITL